MMGLVSEVFFSLIMKFVAVSFCSSYFSILRSAKGLAHKLWRLEIVLDGFI